MDAIKSGKLKPTGASIILMYENITDDALWEEALIRVLGSMKTIPKTLFKSTLTNNYSSKGYSPNSYRDIDSFIEDLVETDSLFIRVYCTPSYVSTRAMIFADKTRKMNLWTPKVFIMSELKHYEELSILLRLSYTLDKCMDYPIALQKVTEFIEEVKKKKKFNIYQK